ncbi:Lrp/AsnC family transcriptional regulator [Oceanibium sediminis]|uniref:Lrp/AsnC family transcriptional regulator n=1 Tax=Oceanibium sediminis TaxID=2026339 RepID=UPI000DD43E67|nr:Lrp/AsnC family transcriptional regulator [Oceanibium sediminis]
MDRQDIEILRILQTDATLSNQALAERTGLSAATVWRRVQSLEAAGLVTARVALLDPAGVGLGTTVVTEVRLTRHNRENRQAFEKMVLASPEIQECYAVSGSHDYQLLIRCADIAAYEHFLMEVLLASEVVASAETSFVLRQIKYTTALPI